MPVGLISKLLQGFYEWVWHYILWSVWIGFFVSGTNGSIQQDLCDWVCGWIPELCQSEELYCWPYCVCSCCCSGQSQLIYCNLYCILSYCNFDLLHSITCPIYSGIKKKTNCGTTHRNIFRNTWSNNFCWEYCRLNETMTTNNMRRIPLWRKLFFFGGSGFLFWFCWLWLSRTLCHKPWPIMNHGMVDSWTCLPCLKQREQILAAYRSLIILVCQTEGDF